jgi:hypothetical protein
MTGTRRDFTDDNPLNAGEYGKHSESGEWYCVPPNHPFHLGALRGHEVTEHDDGSITVSPSILIRHYRDGDWHGYLERGVWREV